MDWENITTRFIHWLKAHRAPLTVAAVVVVFALLGPKTDPDCVGGSKQCPVVIENALQAILFYLSYPLIFGFLLWAFLSKAKKDEDNNRFW